MSYRTDSNFNDLKSLEARINKLVDNQLYSIGVNSRPIIHTNLGGRNASHGPQTGLESALPIAQEMYETVDAGVKNTIRLATTNLIPYVTGIANPVIKWVEGVINDGAKLFLEPLTGETLQIATGGHFTNSTPITLTDQDKAIAIYSKQAGKFKVFVGQAGGGGSNLWSAITIDVNKDMQNKTLTNLSKISFHSTTPNEAEIDGDDYVINYYINGKQKFAMSETQTAGFQGQAVLEVFGHPNAGYLDSNPIASLKTNSQDATPTVGQIMGQFAHDAYNVSGIRRTLLSIETTFDDTTNTTEDAHTDFRVIANGVLATVMQLYGQVGGFTRLQVPGQLVVNNDTILGDASTDTLTIIASLNSSIGLQTDNAFNIGSAGKGLANLYSYKWNHATSGYSLQWVTGQGLRGDVPSGLSYDYYVNSILAAQLTLTGWDMKQGNVIDLNKLNFNPNGGTGALTSEYNIYALSNLAMVYNVPTTKEYRWRWNNSTKYTMEETVFYPNTDNTIILGKSTSRFNWLYCKGIGFTSDADQFVGVNSVTDDTEIGVKTTSDILRIYFDGNIGYDINYTNIDYKGGDIWNLIDVYVDSGSTPIFRLKSGNTGYGLIRGARKAGAPTTVEIPDRFAAVWKNTSDASVKLYYNDAGTLKSVTLT